ncbi:MAG: PDZ domain-containing protein [Planctomycetota bacterium]
MFKTQPYALALVPALALTLVPQAGKPQSAEAAPKRDRLVRVAEDRDGARDAQRAPAFEAEAWKTKLSARDLAARERDFDALVELARRDDGARTALENWAKDEGAGELAWTSRLALRELDRAPRGAGNGWRRTPARSFAAPDFDDLQRQMDELHRRFGGMDDLFSDLQRQMDDLFQGGGPATGPGLQNRVDAHSESFSMKMGPDGVEVTVEEGEGDARHTQTYKANSLEELLEAHPELADRIHGDGSNLSFGPGVRTFHGSTPFAAPARPLLPGISGRETPRLGIQCTQPSADEAKELGLDEGVGLRAETVVAGSLAERLGIQKGDVLVELNGTKITKREDVAEVLQARKSGDELRATIVDAKGKRRSLSYVQKAPRRDDGGAKSEPEGARF